MRDRRSEIDRDLETGYGSVRLLYGVSLEVGQSETVLLLGGNGYSPSSRSDAGSSQLPVVRRPLRAQRGPERCDVRIAPLVATDLEGSAPATFVLAECNPSQYDGSEYAKQASGYAADASAPTAGRREKMIMALQGYRGAAGT